MNGNNPFYEDLLYAQQRYNDLYGGLAGGLGQQQQATMPAGARRVDAALNDEMLIRRTGNICLEARDGGFKVVSKRIGRKWAFTFVRGEQNGTGVPHENRMQAFINATEYLAKNWLGI